MPIRDVHRRFATRTQFRPVWPINRNISNYHNSFVHGCQALITHRRLPLCHYRYFPIKSRSRHGDNPRRWPADNVWSDVFT
jgi:hypothetical protein